MDAGFLLECKDDEAGSDSLLIRYILRMYLVHPIELEVQL